jgi:hypothetical protein
MKKGRDNNMASVSARRCQTARSKKKRQTKIIKAVVASCRLQKPFAKHPTAKLLRKEKEDKSLK